MDIQGLEAFWWVAQTGSFNRAAERLYLTQPSVTARIQALEKSLGQILFERRPRGVVLTEAGQVLLPHAARVLDDARQARQALADLAQASGGTLSLGCALTTSTYTLPTLLTRFKASHPEVEVVVRTGRSQQVRQMVLEDSVQLGLVHAPLTAHPELDTIPLYQEPVVLVVHPEHPLAASGRVVPEMLESAPFITNDRGSTFWALAEQWLAGLGLAPRVTMELDSFEAAKQMVVAGLGLAMLPWGAVEAEVTAGTLAEVYLEGTAPPVRHTVLLYRKGRTWSGVTRAFLGVLGDTYGIDTRKPPG